MNSIKPKTLFFENHKLVFLLLNSLLSFLLVYFNTQLIFSSFLVFVIYLLVIFYIISNNKQFSNFFLITVSYPNILILCYLFFWYDPLIDSDSLVTTTQLPELTDSNYYLYLSESISKNLWQNLYLANSTWLSQGVVLYGTFIYVIFGVYPIFITFINSILFIVLTSKFIKSYDLKVENGFFILLMIISPFTLSYFSILSKEILSVAGLLWFFSNYIKSSTFKSLFMPSFFLLVIRPNLALILFFCFFIYNFRRNFILIILSVIVFFLSIDLFQNLFEAYGSITTILDRNIGALANKNSAIKELIFNLVIHDSVFLNIIFSPLRALIWIISPFPLLEIPILQIFDNSELIKFGSRLTAARSISTIFVVLSIIYMIFNIKSIPKKLNFLVFFLVITVFTISFNSFFEGARYRIIIEPFLFFILAVMNLKNHNISKLIFFILMILSLFIILFK